MVKLTQPPWAKFVQRGDINFDRKYPVKYVQQFYMASIKIIPTLPEFWNPALNVKYSLNKSALISNVIIIGEGVWP